MYGTVPVLKKNTLQQQRPDLGSEEKSHTRCDGQQTKQRKWLTSAKKQPIKGYGNVPTEALKKQQPNNIINNKTWQI
jgi:hypothetical protein